jgi:hypothetical protein
MLTPVRKMGTFSLRREEGQWGLLLNGSFNWPSQFGNLARPASRTAGLGLPGQLGNLGSNGPCWVAEWWFGPFSRPVGWFLVQWAMLAGWLVGWVGNLSWV